MAFIFLAGALALTGVYMFVTARAGWLWAVPYYGAICSAAFAALFLATGQPRPAWLHNLIPHEPAQIVAFLLDEPGERTYIWLAPNSPGEAPTALALPFTKGEAQKLIEGLRDYIEKGEGMPAYGNGPDGPGVKHPMPPAPLPDKQGLGE